jgi:hypothetical protein
MARTIFISYRRADSAGTTGRLCDWLLQTFGAANVFLDVDKMPAGVVIEKHLYQQVTNCDIFLCVIGPNWLDAKDDDGRRRLDQPDDAVRAEIATALNRDIPVIPVLVDGADVPKARDLPGDVAPLIRRSAVEVRNSHFRQDADELTTKIRAILKEKSFAPTGLPLVVISGSALLLFGFIGLYEGGIIALPWLMESGTSTATRTASDAQSPKPDASAATRGVTDPSRSQSLKPAAASGGVGGVAPLPQAASGGVGGVATAPLPESGLDANLAGSWIKVSSSLIDSWLQRDTIDIEKNGHVLLTFGAAKFLNRKGSISKCTRAGGNICIEADWLKCSYRYQLSGGSLKFEYKEGQIACQWLAGYFQKND